MMGVGSLRAKVIYEVMHEVIHEAAHQATCEVTNPNLNVHCVALYHTMPVLQSCNLLHEVASCT